MHVDTKFNLADHVCFWDRHKTGPCIEIITGHVLGISISTDTVFPTPVIKYKLRCYSYKDLLKDPAVDIPFEQTFEVHESSLFFLKNKRECIEAALSIYTKGCEEQLRQLEREENSLQLCIKSDTEKLAQVGKRVEELKEKLAKVRRQ